MFDKNFNLKTQTKEIKWPKIKQNSKIPIVNAMNIGYYIITPLVIGVFLGKVIDNKIGSHFFIIFGIVLGAFGALYNLFRLTK